MYKTIFNFAALVFVKISTQNNEKPNNDGSDAPIGVSRKRILETGSVS
jgi:hypothetical protein